MNLDKTIQYYIIPYNIYIYMVIYIYIYICLINLMIFSDYYNHTYT